MARILISMYNFARDPNNYFAMPPYYEAFVSGLKKAGNEIFCFFHKDYNISFDGDIPSDLLQKIKTFSPEIAIFFNNDFYNIHKYFDIPVVVYDVDSPLYTKHKDIIKDNISKYKFVTIQQDNVGLICDIFGANQKNVQYIKPFTGVQSDKTQSPLHNISFVGANWLWGGADFAFKFNQLLNSAADRQKARDYLASFTQNPLEDLIESYSTTDQHMLTNLKEHSNRLSGIRRARYLTAVADLGLELRGLYWDHPSMAYFPELALCYNKKPIFSLKDNQELYNQSRISLNTNHIQAISGFSWRVCDIMASNACLVTEKKPDMLKLFKGIDLPMFTNATEARELCLRLLREENYRQDIVEACHEMIDKNYRFHHALDVLESFLNVSLRTDKVGSIEFYTDLMLKAQTKSGVSSSHSSGLSEFEKKHKALAYLLQKRKIQICSAFIWNKQKRREYRQAKRMALDKRFTEFDRLGWYLQQQKKISSIVSRLKSRDKDQKIRVAFFVVFDGVFPGETVFQNMIGSSVFDPIIVVIPDVSRGNENMHLQMEKTYEYLKDKYGSKVFCAYHADTENFLDYSNRVDIVCSANPYDSMTHHNYRVRTLLDKGVISFYINYGYPTVRYAREVFARQFCSLQWKYFIEATDLIPEYEQHEIIHGKNTVAIGYPKMDALATCNVDVKRERKRIIIAPHHTVRAVGGLQLSNFLRYAEFFLELPKRYPEVDFVFRPHPLLFITLAKDDMWGEARVSEYLEAINGIPNMEYQSGGDYLETFMNSDGIIHDCSSFMPEWLFTEKKGCYLLRSEDEIEKQFMPFGVKLMRLYHKAFNEDDVITYIDHVIQGNDEDKEGRVQTVRDLLKMNYPNVSTKIVKYLEDQFQ